MFFSLVLFSLVLPMFFFMAMLMGPGRNAVLVIEVIHRKASITSLFIEVEAEARGNHIRVGVCVGDFPFRVVDLFFAVLLAFVIFAFVLLIVTHHFFLFGKGCLIDSPARNAQITGGAGSPGKVKGEIAEPCFQQTNTTVQVRRIVVPVFRRALDTFDTFTRNAIVNNIDDAANRATPIEQRRWSS